ncbi:FAD-dependent oxidoreductase [Bacilliculturomica massiliensis]|uniref:FAD-dependent oxidoreductase n=1 Tax=Bacilliculturomica massiliensis TaxID=1917867 RepID=UPI001031B5F7|nr:FAD-dependent oxidoreductase [Bacilliculturomica massiliensis]
MERYDAVIIGFGKGGKTLAGKLAAAGKTVAVIERSDRMYGGTCINVGCIPSKSLVKNAKQAAHNPEWSFEEKAAFYAAAIEEKRGLTTALRKKNFDKLNDMNNVDIYNGQARFLSADTVEVSTAEETLVLEGDKIFINTGAEPVIPPIEGLKDNSRVYFSETMLDLETLPRRMAIIGGGYIGMEFASIYSGFGSQVTVFQDGGVFLPKEDEDMAAEIRGVLEEKGVNFRLGAEVEKFEDGPEVSRIVYRWKGESLELEADAILVATGRRPNTEGLNAEAAGVELTPRGAVKVDDNRKTTAENIWAMGDVAGGLQFTYVSLDDFRIVWSQLCEGCSSGKPNYTADQRRNVPYSVFLEPSFSRVGLNEREARAAGYHVRIAKLPAAAIPKAQVLKQPRGLLKAVIDQETGRILGAMLFCEESHEMINIVKLAMDLDVHYTVLRDQIFTHPTMSEALNDLFS